MPEPLVDLSTLNLNEVVVPEEELRRALPHDHEFRLIDSICHMDVDEGLVVGVKDWGAQPWWARGHVPGRPLMPGVLMIEGCAQVAAILVVQKSIWPDDALIGLGGVDRARFRREVTPPARVYFVARLVRKSRRLVKYTGQCVVNGEIALETDLLGVPL